MIKKLKNYISILFLIALFCVNAFASDQDAYLNYLYKARVFFHLGNYKGAISEYDQVLKVDPDDKIALLNKALMYRNVQNYKKAIALLEGLLSKEVNGVLLKNLGEIYYLNSMPEKAAKCFKKAKKLGFNDRLIYFWLGLCYEDIGNFKNAIKSYKRALSLDNDFAIAHYCLAKIYIKQQLWEDAQKQLEITEKLDPSIKDIYSDLIIAYFNQKLYEKSLASCRKLKAVSPDNLLAKNYINKINAISGKKLEEKLSKRETKRIKSSQAKKVSFKKISKSPIIDVHIGNFKRIRFKVNSNFFIEENGLKVDDFKGKKNELYSLEKKDNEIVVKYGDKSILKVGESIGIFYNNPNSTILLFDVKSGTGNYWASKSDRIYRGGLKINILDNNEDDFSVVNSLSMEEYLYGVLPSEMPNSWPQEALKAQAVAARSEAYKKIKRHEKQGYNFCSGVHCQAYNGAKVETKKTNKAVNATIGMVAVYNKLPIDAVYSNSCGGHTQGNIFFKRDNVPYLQHKKDTDKKLDFFFPLSALELEDWLFDDEIPVFCNNTNFSRKSNFRWQRLYTKEQLEKIINKTIDIGKLNSIEIVERLPSSHVHSIKIKGTKGDFFIEKELNIRNILGDLRSGMFNFYVKVDKNKKPELFLFYGGGWGHGVGLCQVGAATMAERGFDFKQIIKFYFTDIELKNIY